MPQLDKFTYFSQFFWLCLFLFIFYIPICNDGDGVLGISRILKLRNQLVSHRGNNIRSKDPKSLEDILRKGFCTGVSYMDSTLFEVSQWCKAVDLLGKRRKITLKSFMKQKNLNSMSMKEGFLKRMKVMVNSMKVSFLKRMKVMVNRMKVSFLNWMQNLVRWLFSTNHKGLLYLSMILLLLLLDFVRGRYPFFIMSFGSSSFLFYLITSMGNGGGRKKEEVEKQLVFNFFLSSTLMLVFHDQAWVGMAEAVIFGTVYFALLSFRIPIKYLFLAGLLTRISIVWVTCLVKNCSSFWLHWPVLQTTMTVFFCYVYFSQKKCFYVAYFFFFLLSLFLGESWYVPESLVFRPIQALFFGKIIYHLYRWYTDSLEKRESNMIIFESFIFYIGTIALILYKRENLFYFVLFFLLSSLFSFSIVISRKKSPFPEPERKSKMIDSEDLPSLLFISFGLVTAFFLLLTFVGLFKEEIVQNHYLFFIITHLFFFGFFFFDLNPQDSQENKKGEERANDRKEK